MLKMINKMVDNLSEAPIDILTKSVKIDVTRMYTMDCKEGLNCQLLLLLVQRYK